MVIETLTDDHITELKKYFTKHKLWETMNTIIQAKDSIDSRVKYLFSKKLKQLEREIKRITKTYDFGKLPNEQPKIGTLIRKAHYTQLELIKELSVLIETFLVYFHYLRDNSKYKKITKYLDELDGPTHFNIVHNEEEHIKKISMRAIAKDFRFPNVSRYDLSATDRKLTRICLSDTAKSIKKSLKSMVDFRKNYSEVYNKYKHTLSERTGQVMPFIEGGVNKLATMIYLCGTGKTQKGKKRVKTYIINGGVSAKNYYRNVAKDVYTLFLILLENNWLFLFNKETESFPFHFYKHSGTTKKQISKIIRNVDSIYVPIFSGQTTATWKPEAFMKVVNKLNRYSVTYKLGNIFTKKSKYDIKKR